jgi:hypothetical protein
VLLSKLKKNQIFLCTRGALGRCATGIFRNSKKAPTPERSCCGCPSVGEDLLEEENGEEVAGEEVAEEEVAEEEVTGEELAGKEVAGEEVVREEVVGEELGRE